MTIRERHRGGLHRFMATQNLLWEQYFAELRPWEREGELRWVRHPLTGRWHLRGGVLSAPP